MPYSRVTVIVQSEARAGETVNVELQIQNLIVYTIEVIPVMDVNGDRVEGSFDVITEGQTRSWFFTFAMPAKDVVVTGESWCASDFHNWQLCNSASKSVKLKVVSEFKNLVITSTAKVED